MMIDDCMEARGPRSAWVCRPDGTLIDPTLPSDGGAYFPGLEFRGRAGIEQFLATERGRRCRRSPFLYAFGWGGAHSPDFPGAWEEALSFMTQLWTSQQEVVFDEC